MENVMKYLLNIIMVLILAAGSLPAQDRPEIKAGADLVSRYIWRGFDIGSAPSLQPAISGSYKGLSVGVWGAYALSNESSGVDEIDGWLSYTIYLKSIAISALVTDYYYPNLGGDTADSQNDLFNYADSGGAHILEAGLQIAGPRRVGVKFSAYYNFRNEPGHCTYFELSYRAAFNSVALDLFAGATGGSVKNPAFYQSENFSFINVGVGVTKQIPLGESFALPLFIRFIVNPAIEKAYLIGGISL